MNADVDAAVDALDRGDVVVIPTETVYGLAARLDRPAAIEKIFALKERAAEKVLQVLVFDATWLAKLGEPSSGAIRVATGCWPGPLTLVVRAREGVPAAATRGGTVGIRVPDHPLARAVIGRAGPLAASSANLAGRPTPPRPDEIRTLFGDRVAVYLDGGEIAAGGSTVLDVSGGEPRLVREGPLPFAHVRALYAGSRFERG